MQVKDPTGRKRRRGRGRGQAGPWTNQERQWTIPIGSWSLGMLRFSLQSADNLNISCTSLGNHHSRQSSVPTLSVSGAGKRHFVGAEVGRGWWWQKPESRRKAESLWTRCCRNKPELQTRLPTPCQGLLDWQAQCPQEQSLSTSSEARFIFNRVSQNDYRISHSLSHKATYTQFCFLFVCFLLLFIFLSVSPYPPIQIHKLKVKYIRHCCILHWRC